MSKARQKPVLNDGHLINEHIPDKQMFVITSRGENLGLVSRREAFDAAAAENLDLVKVGDRDGSAVVKIMDFGKFLYAKKKQTVKAKKAQKVIQVKEIKMRPKIGVGDYQTKMSQAVKFLAEGKRVKFTLQFRGRQPVSIREVGGEFFTRVMNDLKAHDLGTLLEEKESKSGRLWSKIIYVKSQ